MPGYRTHLVGGAAAFGLLYATLTITTGVATTFIHGAEWLGCALLGSLFPDVDTKSMGQKVFYRLLFIGALYLLYKQQFVALGLTGIAAMVPLLVNHRGIFHKFWFILLIPIPLLAYVAEFQPFYWDAALYDTFFFMAGALSHLILDLGIRRTFRL